MSKSKTVWATIVGVLSSVFAFLGLIGCCGLPILAGVLAWLGIGASQLSFFAKYQWWFIGFAIVALLFGFYQVYFKKNKGCCETTADSCCSSDTGKSKSRLFQKIFLWIGAVVIAVMLIIGFTEKSAVNSSAGGCCPGEEAIQNSGGCCPSGEAVIDDGGCCPAPVQPEKEEIQTGCCPQ